MRVMLFMTCQRRSMKKRLEKDVVKAIIQYLKTRGYCCGKVKTHGVVRQGRYCIDPYLFVGVPDILCFTGTEQIWIEAKVNKNKQGPAQVEFEKLCNKVGIKYILAYSVDDIIKIGL